MDGSVRSIRLRLRPAAAAWLAAAVAAVPARGVAAQGTVSGRITVLEREGSRTTDLDNAVVWLEPAGGNGTGAAPSAPQIVMESRTFRPAVRVVTPGSTVPFPNYDPFRHNVFSNTGPGAFDLGLYGRGEVRSARIDRPGIYSIFCNIHARMVAYVVAVPAPWYAQAGADGRFEIPRVPAGRYRLRAWHDRAGEHAQDVTVGEGGATVVDVALDARGWRPRPHKNKFGQEYPPESRDRY
jgi:plastocyanin